MSCVDDESADDDGRSWPETRADAAELIDHFEREAWPIYKRRGFKFAHAIQTHLLAQAVRRLDQLIESRDA